jgi:DNA-binding protein HU-beta
MATKPTTKTTAAAKPAAKAAPAKAAAAPTKAGPAPKAAPAKKAAPAAGKSAAPAVVTMKQIGAHLSEKHSMPKRDVESLLGAMVETVTEHLKKGDRIRIGGLGVLEVKNRAARMGRNPATGAPIQIKASKKIAFRPAKELKEAV